MPDNKELEKLFSQAGIDKSSMTIITPGTVHKQFSSKVRSLLISAIRQQIAKSLNAEEAKEFQKQFDFYVARDQISHGSYSKFISSIDTWIDNSIAQLDRQIPGNPIYSVTSLIENSVNDIYRKIITAL